VSLHSYLPKSYYALVVPPRWIVEPPSEKAFALGSDARLECKSDGFPKPTLAWKKAAGMFSKI